MGILSIMETDDAVSGLSALRDVLADDLLDIESRLDEMERSSTTSQIKGKNDDALVYRTARTALLSGLASIDEVLGWVHLVAEKDADGNELESVLSLPHLSVMRAS